MFGQDVCKQRVNISNRWSHNLSVPPHIPRQSGSQTVRQSDSQTVRDPSNASSARQACGSLLSPGRCQCPPACQRASYRSSVPADTARQSCFPPSGGRRSSLPLRPNTEHMIGCCPAGAACSLSCALLAEFCSSSTPPRALLLVSSRSVEEEGERF